MYLFIDAIFDPSSWLSLLLRQPSTLGRNAYLNGHIDSDAVFS